jgi:hypothetical protein
LSAALGGTPAYFAGGIPVAADGRTCVEAAVATKYTSGGIPLTATGRVALATAELVFLDEMSVSHILTVGINPGGNRVGYRRGEWGDFQPNDVPSLSRLFTNLSNNRLVVQADGDMSTLVISNIHIHRISNGANFNFGAPSSVLFDGVVTDFTWIVPFDFVLGEQYTVSLS